MLNKIFSCKWFTSKLFILLPSSFSITKVRLSHISQVLVAVFLQTVKIPQGCCKLVRVAQQRGRIWACFEDIAAFSDMNFTLLEIQPQSFWSESNPVLVFLFFPHLQGATPTPLLVLLKLPTQRHPSTFRNTHGYAWHLFLYNPAFQEELVLNPVATAISGCRSAEHPAGGWKYTATSGCHGSTQQTYRSQNPSEQPASQHEAAFLLPSFPLISRRKVCFHSRETKLLCCCLSVDKLLVCSATRETASVLQQAI